jgi:hypothetical protein
MFQKTLASFCKFALQDIFTRCEKNAKVSFKKLKVQKFLNFLYKCFVFIYGGIEQLVGSRVCKTRFPKRILVGSSPTTITKIVLENSFKILKLLVC